MPHPESRITIMEKWKNRRTNMKTKITKRLAALGLAMLMVLGMAACGNNSSSGSPDRG